MRVKLILQNPQSGAELILKYRLFDFPVVKTWAALVDEANRRSCSVWENGMFYGAKYYGREELVAEFSRVLRVINAAHGMIIVPAPHQNLTQTELNHYHDWFEKLTRDPAYSAPEVRQALDELNTLVHRFEKILRPSNSHFVSVRFHPRIQTLLKPEDFQHFSLDRFFGELYLDYATVGVPFLDAFLGHADATPTPQWHCTPDAVLFFGDDMQFSEKERLSRFLNEKYQREISDPNLALGFIPLGRLDMPGISKNELFEEVRRHRFVKSLTVEWQALAWLRSNPFADL